MAQKSIKIVASASILAAALGGLFYTTLREGTEYYLHVDEVMTDPGAWHGKKLQLHGYVVEKSILQRPNSLDYRFRVENKGAVVQASYTGVVPDTFKGGSEVVLKGHLDGDGFAVDRDGVMAKCPSKYEANKKPRPGT